MGQKQSKFVVFDPKSTGHSKINNSTPLSPILFLQTPKCFLEDSLHKSEIICAKIARVGWVPNGWSCKHKRFSKNYQFWPKTFLFYPKISPKYQKVQPTLPHFVFQALKCPFRATVEWASILFIDASFQKSWVHSRVRSEVTVIQVTHYICG